MMELDKSVKVRFTRRRIPIPVEYRPLYKIAQVLLVIQLCGRGGKISLLKLQLFIWALKSPDNQRTFRAIVEGTRNYSLWSLDPTVVRAVNYAVAQKLCERVQGSIAITTHGQRLVHQIRTARLLAHPITFLEEIGKSVTEQKIKAIAKDWLV